MPTYISSGLALDRCLVSQDNLDFLKARQRQYLVETPKSQLKRFEQQLAGQGWRVIREGLEVKLCQCPDGTTETYILCRSRDRQEKEQAMIASIMPAKHDVSSFHPVWIDRTTRNRGLGAFGSFP